MARRVNRDRKGVIRLYGTPKPKPQPRPPSREHRSKKAAKPPPVVRESAAPATTKAKAPSQPTVELSARSNGSGQAKSHYSPSRFCQCDKPLVIADREISRFDVAIESRCLRCGKSRGGANAPDNNS